MEQVVLATSEADALAAEAVERHHAQLAGALAHHVEALVRAAAAGDAGRAEQARSALVTWCERELVPHALAEEASLYVPAQAKPEGRLLVAAMLAEHQRIVGLVRELGRGGDVVRQAAAARALQVMFDSHLAKENECVLPLLLADVHVSVAQLLGGMHELLGQQETEADARGDGHSCGCAETDGPGFPELDARAVPHAIRHATVFGALDAVPPGGGLVLLAPHDPLPLLRQVEERSPGAFAVDYLERGPEVWRLVFTR